MNGVINFFMGRDVVPGVDPDVNTPTFVTEGWNFSRSMVNIIFILILTFIGLATILRLQSYQLQKTLPSLIIIAILVNFSGVLVGFVADIGNILTRVFLSNEVLGGLGFGKATFTLSGPGQLAQLIFYTIATLIFFILMLLFAVRTMILWVLTIVSPLAFAARILPGTQKYWNQWLQTLIQWSLIGVPIGFSMYLAKSALGASIVTETDIAIGTALGNLIAPLTSLFILFVGITLSMQLAPAGASGIIDRGKKWGIGIGKLAGKKTLGFARDRISESARARGFMDKMNQWSTKSPKIGEQVQMRWYRPDKWALRGLQAGAEGVAGAGLRVIPTAARNLTTKADKTDSAAAKTASDKKDMVENLRALRTANNDAEKVGILAAMVGKKQLKDALDPEKMGKDALSTEELKKIYGKANAMGDDDNVEAIERSLLNNPDALKELATVKTSFMKESDRVASKDGVTQDDLKKGITSFSAKIIAGTKSADDMKQLGKGWWEKNKEALDATHQFWGGPQFQTAITEHGRELADNIEQSKKSGEWYLEIDPATKQHRNAKALQWFESNGGQFGVSAITGYRAKNEISAGMATAKRKWVIEHPSAAGIAQEETELQSINTEFGGDLKQKTDELTQQLTSEQERARREAQNNPALRGDQKAVNQAVSNDPMVRAVQAELKSLRTRQQTLATRKFQLEKDKQAKQDALKDMVSYDDLVKEEQTEQQRLKAVTEDIKKKEAEVERVKQTTPEGDPERVKAEKDLADLKVRKDTIDKALGKIREIKQERSGHARAATYIAQNRETGIENLVAALENAQPLPSPPAGDIPAIRLRQQWQAALDAFRKNTLGEAEQAVNSKEEQKEANAKEAADLKVMQSNLNQELVTAQKKLEDLTVTQANNFIQNDPEIQRLGAIVNLKTPGTSSTEEEQRRQREQKLREQFLQYHDTDIKNLEESVADKAQLIQTIEQGITAKEQRTQELQREQVALVRNFYSKERSFKEKIAEAAAAINSGDSSYTPPDELKDAFQATQRFKTERIEPLRKESNIRQGSMDRAELDAEIKVAIALSSTSPRIEPEMEKELKQDIKEAKKLSLEISNTANRIKLRYEKSGMIKREIENLVNKERGVQQDLDKLTELERTQGISAELRDEQIELKDGLRRLKTEQEKQESEMRAEESKIQELLGNLRKKKQEFEKFQADDITPALKRFQEDRQFEQQGKAEEKKIIEDNAKRLEKIGRKNIASRVQDKIVEGVKRKIRGGS